MLCVPCPADSFKSETSEADKCSACPIYSTTRNLKSRVSATACQVSLTPSLTLATTLTLAPTLTLTLTPTSTQTFTPT